MNLRTYTDGINQLRVLCDPDSHDWAASYEIRYEGRSVRIEAEPGESDESTWAQVLSTITYLRWSVRVGGWPGNPDAYATVYAGITPTGEQERQHHRAHISGCLYRIAEDPKTPNRARMEAYAALCKLHGLTITDPKSLSDLLRAEKARRAQMRALEQSWSQK